jgi:hypothetical protein
MFSVKQHINNKVVMFTLLSHSFWIFYCLFDSSKGGGRIVTITILRTPIFPNALIMQILILDKFH